MWTTNEPDDGSWDFFIDDQIADIVKSPAPMSISLIGATNKLYKAYLNGYESFDFRFNVVDNYRVMVEHTKDYNKTPAIHPEKDYKKRVWETEESTILTVYLPPFDKNHNILEIKRLMRSKAKEIFRLLMSQSDWNKNLCFDRWVRWADQTLYNTSVGYYDRMLAEYIYCCSSELQDIWLKELYHSLTEAHPPTVFDETPVVKVSNIYKALRFIIDMRFDMQDVNGSSNYATPIVNLGLRPFWVIRIGRVAERRIKHGMARIIKKVRLECNTKSAT